jgi:transposase
VICRRITIKESQVSGDDSASVVGALFGLDGFEVLSAGEVDGELEVLAQTTTDLMGCPRCGVVAEPKDRRPCWVRDLPIGGRPVVVCWWKRVWRCPHPLCETNTWTETHEAIAPRSSLTERARQWAFAQVGERDDTVAATARALGVGWHTIMRLVRAIGTPVIADPDRTDPPEEPVRAIGVDETTFLAAAPTHPTEFATGIADLTPGRPARLLEVTRGRSGAALDNWLAGRGPEWKQRITTASLDPFRGYATALNSQLPEATRVLDPFHVTKLALSCVDEVRRRVQQHSTGHRGRTGDPLYGIRRVLRRRRDRLSVTARARLETGLITGDADGETTLAWTVAQDLMSLYQLRDPDLARRRAERLIADLRDCPIPELARLGRTLRAWRGEFMAHFDHPTVSNGPTESLNLKIKNTKRKARGFRNFANYRLRLLLNHGRIHHAYLTSRIRTRRPSLVA